MRKRKRERKGGEPTKRGLGKREKQRMNESK